MNGIIENENIKKEDNQEIFLQAARAAKELCERARLKRGQLVVVGCSSSEVNGDRIGSNSRPETAEMVLRGILQELSLRGIYLAAQCCEHLNRALILEREAAVGLSVVNVLPRPKAGGSFATAAYQAFRDPVAVEHIAADAGMDIGGTLIGMHLREVAVPLRLEQNRIGCAQVLAARTRPKCIGGARAVYDEELL